MKKNMGNTDKAIRLLVAALIIILAVTKVITGTWVIILLILSAVFLLTGIISFCPLYKAFGFTTNKQK